MWRKHEPRGGGTQKSPLLVPPQSQTHFRTLSSWMASSSGKPLGRSSNAEPGWVQGTCGKQKVNGWGWDWRGVKPQVSGSQGQFQRVRKLKADPWR